MALYGTPSCCLGKLDLGVFEFYASGLGVGRRCREWMRVGRGRGGFYAGLLLDFGVLGRAGIERGGFVRAQLSRAQRKRMLYPCHRNMMPLWMMLFMVMSEERVFC